MAGVLSQKYLKMQCRGAGFVPRGRRALHYCNSGCWLKNKPPCAHFPTQSLNHCGLGDPLWNSSRIVPTAVAACGLFGWLCYPTGISWQVLFSIMHSELPLVRLIVSHHLQILCLNLIRNLLTEKWSSLLELSNRPGKWRTLLL